MAVIVACGALAGWLLRARIELWVAGIHQKSVTHSLREWGLEYATVTNDTSAVAAAEMVGYMSRYYVPSPGYRGPTEIEAALDTERRESIARVTDALQHYTRLDYGTNAQRWAEWADTRKAQLSGRNGSKQNGPGNATQPIHSETNPMSSSGGPRR
jgi:hypothetical protein